MGPATPCHHNTATPKTLAVEDYAVRSWRLRLAPLLDHGGFSLGINMILSEDTNDSCFIRAYRDEEGNIAIRTTSLYSLAEYSGESGELSGKYSVNAVIIPAADLSDLIDALQHLFTDKGQI